jgi:hypothetical protein
MVAAMEQRVSMSQLSKFSHRDERISSPAMQRFFSLMMPTLIRMDGMVVW